MYHLLYEIRGIHYMYLHTLIVCTDKMKVNTWEKLIGIYIYILGNEKYLCVSD